MPSSTPEEQESWSPPDTSLNKDGALFISKNKLHSWVTPSQALKLGPKKGIILVTAFHAGVQNIPQAMGGRAGKYVSAEEWLRRVPATLHSALQVVCDNLTL